MGGVSDATRARVHKADERFAAAEAELEAAQAELVDALREHKADEGLSYEDTARETSLGTSRVFRMLKRATGGSADES
jgi:hypothetical protein